MAQTYDVIIIGSGAGGGTLARHLAPSGKRILILERGGWLPRELENWDAEEVFMKNRYVPKETWYDKRGQGLPAGRALLGRGRDQALRRGPLPPAPGGLRRAQALRRRLPGLADLLRRDGAVLHQGGAALPGARRPRGGPHRAPGQRPLPVPRRLPRAAHPAAARRPGAGRLPPLPLPQRGDAQRGAAPVQRLHPLPDLRRLPLPASTPSRTPRCSACARRCSIPTSPC